MFLCNYLQFDKHRKPKSTFFMELNPAPFLTHQGANEHDGFHLKQHLSKDPFNVSLMWNRSCSEVSAAHSDGKRQRSSPAAAAWNPFNAYFSPIILVSWLQAVWGKLHLWVSQPHSVYFCIRRKSDGFVGGLGQSKQWRSQHSKQTLPHVWSAHLEPYSSPTHSLALSPRSPIPANTSFFFFSF